MDTQPCMVRSRSCNGWDQNQIIQGERTVSGKGCSSASVDLHYIIQSRGTNRIR
jgi:hypothetical protein